MNQLSLLPKLYPARKKEGRKKVKNKPRVVSLFSGCGGLDLGFHQANFDVIYANDIEPSVKATYEHNIGNIFIEDFCKVKKEDLPGCDVILAGIPCQPFSNAGNRGSMNDKRGNLFKEVMKAIDCKQPSIVVFENVRGFMSSKDDEGIPMPERIKRELKKHKYNLYYKLLNSADFEVPQNRYRVFMIGIREDIDKGLEFPLPILDKQNSTVENVLSKLPPKDEEFEVWPLSPQSLKMAKHIPPGGSWKNVPTKSLPERLKKIKREIKKYRSPNFYRRFALDEIMGTITAAATPENSGIIHPHEDRRYSVREIARFQSFPDEFKFIGCSTTQKYKMIGNAVPVNLAYHVATVILEQYFGAN
jgi:DNA (cytosine-5)-methyltransferase 1